MSEGGVEMQAAYIDHGDHCVCIDHYGEHDPDDICGEMSDDNWQCTRPPGHDDVHVACSSSEHCHDIWGQDSPSEDATAEVEAETLVAVDFDGTLTQGETRYWSEDDGPEQPREDVVEWVREQYYNGGHVIVWTARPWSQASRVTARLTEWGVPYHGIRCEKGGADLYVEDKAVRPAEAVDGGDIDGLLTGGGT